MGLGDFFTNSSGHPGVAPPKTLDRRTRCNPRGIQVFGEMARNEDKQHFLDGDFRVAILGTWYQNQKKRYQIDTKCTKWK
jgi:hypothetical protein